MTKKIILSVFSILSLAFCTYFFIMYFQSAVLYISNYKSYISHSPSNFITQMIVQCVIGSLFSIIIFIVILIYLIDLLKNFKSKYKELCKIKSEKEIEKTKNKIEKLKDKLRKIEKTE